MFAKGVLGKSTFILALIVFGKVFSFLRDILISYEFGVSDQTDAYFVANSIPTLIYTAIISSFTALIVPVYKKIQIDESLEKADLYSSKLIILTIIFSLSLTSIAFLSVETLVEFLSPGFEVNKKELAIELGRILVLSFPLSSLVMVLANISNAHNRNYALHIVPLVSAIFVMTCIYFFSSSYGVFILAYAGVSVYFLQLLLQIILLPKAFKFRFSIKLNDENVKKTMILMLPIFIGHSVDQLNVLINTTFSSYLELGTLSSLNYAQRIQNTLNGTISMALITVIYPIISVLYVKNKDKQLSLISLKSLNLTFFILTPLVFIFFQKAEYIVGLVYGRGSFTENAVSLTAAALSIYSFNILILAIREILIRFFYVHNMTKIPFYTSLLSLAINTLLCYLFYSQYGIKGIALANILASSISLLLIFYLVNTKTRIKFDVNNILQFIRQNILSVSAAFLLVVYLSEMKLVKNSIVNFLLYTAFVYISYLLVYVAVNRRKSLNIFKLKYDE